MVYASEDVPLALIEIGIEIDDLKTLRDTHVCVEFTVDENLVSELPDKDYPPNWKAVPAGQKTRIIGEDWAKSMSSVVLKVRSIHGGYNYLLNPSHPDFAKIDVSPVRPLSDTEMD